MVGEVSKHYYPIALDLDGKRCLVVGGGEIATQKAEGLLASGAEVLLVSLDLSARLAELEERGVIEVRRRPYERRDLDGVYLAYGATDDRAVNARVTEDARIRGILVNAVDDIPNCDFFAVAVVRRGDLQIAISTNGKSPAFARWMRECLDESLPAELGGLLEAMAEARNLLKDAGTTVEYENWKSAISPHVLHDVRAGQIGSASERILSSFGGRT